MELTRETIEAQRAALFTDMVNAQAVVAKCEGAIAACDVFLAILAAPDPEPDAPEPSEPDAPPSLPGGGDY